MKKVLMSLAAVAAVFAGCQKPELEVAPVEVKDAFTASVENFDATKTALDGNHVVWSTADQLAIFQGFGVADLYEIADASAGSSSAKFVHKTSGLGDDFFGGVEMNDPRNVAFYPYAEGLGAYSEEGAWVVTNVTLPATQVYSENSFGNGAFPMVAVTETMDDHNLRFKNVLGAVKFQFTGSAVVKSIALKGNNGEVLAGKATVIAHDGFETPSVVLAEDGATEVVLDCGEGVKLSSVATNFVLALPPVEFEKGFTATVTYTSGKTYTVEATAANEVLRSGILAMPEVELWASLDKLGDVTLAANPSMTDGVLNITVDNADATGFYGVFMSAMNWESFGPMLADPEMLNMVLTGVTIMEGMPGTLYEGKSYNGKLSKFALPAEYTQFFSNDVMPGTAYKVIVIPTFEGKESYSLEDAQIFDVETVGLKKGAKIELPEYKIVEGYSATQVIFPADENIIYARYQVLDIDAAIPTEEDYFETITNEARYYDYETETYLPIAENGFIVDVENDYGVAPGAKYKLAVLLANASGEACFYVIDVKTLELPINTELVTSIAAAEFDPLTNSLVADIEVPAAAVGLYCTCNTVGSYDEYSEAGTLINIINGECDFDYIDLTQEGIVNDGVVNVAAVVTNNSYRAQNNAMHIILVDADKKVSHIISSAKVTCDKKSN